MGLGLGCAGSVGFGVFHFYLARESVISPSERTCSCCWDTLARDFSNSAKSLKFSFLFSFSIEGICKSDFLCYMSNFKARQPQGSDDL